tara:strand:+ start:857 stop:1807 length:951 start_codon:yes stop_codon:yes gene_type:complete
MEFVKSNLKSPCGGYFDIFIDYSNNIIYKKIKSDLFTISNIKVYTNILNNIGNEPILNKYILNSQTIKVENTGSYYSTYIPNGIRLYDIEKNTEINNEILNNILNVVCELKKKLNEYSNKKKLKGDWALHNLIYCLDRKKVYNIDLEGFYTYPLIYDNGNCDIKYCNKRFDDLIILLSNRINNYFTLILWNPTLFQVDNILRDIPNIIEKKTIIIEKEKLYETIFDIYKLDKRCSHNIVLPPKIEMLKKYETTHMIIKFNINNPTYNKNICNEAVRLKEIIRNKYKCNVKNYIKDIIIHVADNFEQSKYIWDKNAN